MLRSVALWLVVSVSSISATEVGMASVDYGRVTRFDAHGFHGLVATGERFRASIYAIAHRTLPLKSCVKVRYRKRETIAVVNDRGPCLSPQCRAKAPARIRMRIADLTPALASYLRFPGLGKIELEPTACH